MSINNDIIRSAISIASIILTAIITITSVAIIANTSPAISASHFPEAPRAMEIFSPVEEPTYNANKLVWNEAGTELVMIQFIEFPPMHINGNLPLNN